MKTLLFLLLSASITLAANTNEIFFVLLHTAQGDYTNATIIRVTPAYVVVDWTGGLAKVFLTNLPPLLQKQFGYDPQKAADLLVAEKQHRADVLNQQVEYQKYLASLRGTNRVILVSAVLDSFGQCQTSAGRIYVQGLPPTVAFFYNRRARLKSDTDRLQNYQPTVTATAVNTADPAFDAWLAAQDALQNAKEAKAEKLRQMKDELVELNDNQLDYTSIVAYPTGLNHSGIPIWQAAGMAR